MPAYIYKKGCLCVRDFKNTTTKESAFFDYWKQRWPGVSCDENKLALSANYKNTRHAFMAGLDIGKDKG